MVGSNNAPAGGAKRIEDWLERLIDDRKLRDQLFSMPSAACDSTGLTLSWSELGALLALPQSYLDEFARALPERLSECNQADLASDWVGRPH
ncbi:MAG TPA: Os1348 family NHLP clan protein [Terriglobales bacterium]|nr:Os1348 family NHLP clan protein [Terriglobales bacterium]